jgi:secreted PhoX family phosphatase
MHRRDLLRLATAAAGASLAASPWSRALAANLAEGGPSPYGPLLPPDENGLQLPAGFRSRIIARAGEPVSGTSYVWMIFPDGGATYATRGGGWIYVANSEFVPPEGGGVSAIRFSRSGEIEDAYNICTGTMINCAGGKTPWGTWLTCEEFASGHVWECDPTGQAPAVRRDPLGTFQHEAVAADPVGRRLYLTEDVPDGGFYRFTPTRWGNLEAGVLEIASVSASGRVDWFPVENPNPTSSETPTRQQVDETTPFRGGEGIAYSRRHIYFTTKGDNRVWDYEPSTRRLRVLYENASDPARQLAGVDNVTASEAGDLVVAEGGDNLELVLITAAGDVSPLARLTGHEGSELAGPAFSPSEQHLYFSSQRGGEGSRGVTFEVTGPFRRVTRPRGLPFLRNLS